VSNRLRVSIAVAVICLGGTAGFLAAYFGPSVRTQGVIDPSQTRRPAALTAEPAPTDLAQGGRTSAKPIPDVLPDIALTGIDGAKHKLSEWKGRPLMINFWATWCEPCRREIPLLKTLRRERAAEGVEIVGIAVDFRDAVQHYSREMGIDYPVLVGEQDGLDAISAFGMDTVFPFTVFADRQGRVVTLKIGELRPDEGRFILDVVKRVDHGETDLAVAKRQIADGVAQLAAERAKRDVQDSD
jgi:thiol-disulfide isomerase/thioredoxin